MSFDIDRLDFAKSGGTVTIVVQHAVTAAVLMVAHADRNAVEKTLETGEMHYTSRTRGPWHKGATSGNTQRVVSLTADCDADSVLARVIPAGPACHTGQPSCFGSNSSDIVAELDHVIALRAGGSDALEEKSYTRRLLSDRNLRMKKIGEESVELVLALADEDGVRAKEEAADLIFHVLVALRSAGVSYDDVRSTLASRRSHSES